MNGSGKVKYVLGKVVFLGIFVLGLLLAQLHISARSRLVLSMPFELPYTGISVRMPLGNGWHSESAWQFIANTFTISSIFSPTTGSIAASVEVQYLTAPMKVRPEQQFKRYSRELAGTVLETGKIQNSGVLIDWARIKIQNKFLDVFFGVAQLPNGRRLSIEVQAPSLDADWTEEIFTKIAESVSFEDNYLLENGRRIVEKLKTKGLAQVMPNHQHRFFLVRNEKEQINGFLTNLISISSGEQGPNNVRLAELYHIRIRQGLFGGHSLFQGDRKLQQFLWISKTDSPGAVGETTVQIELTEDSLMTVKSYMPLVSRSYNIGPAAIPEIFLEPLVGLFVDSGITEALVDLIFTNGRIVPTRLSVIDTGRTNTDPPAAYIAKLDFLDQQGYYEQIYLDENKELFKAVLHRENTYIFQRSDKDEILEYFPVWRDYFFQMEKQNKAQRNEL